MKLFLSWSGPASHKIAETFREWLPLILQHVEPYISSEINKGARWTSDIALELQSSNFGLIFVTPENRDAPWIMFEAGALAKARGQEFRCANFVWRPGNRPAGQSARAVSDDEF